MSPKVRIVVSPFGSGAMYTAEEAEKARGRRYYRIDASQHSKWDFLLPSMRNVMRESAGTAEVVFLDCPCPQSMDEESAAVFARTFSDKEIVVFCHDRSEVPAALRNLTFPSSLKNSLRSEVETLDSMTSTTPHLSQIRNKCLELLALLETEGP